MATQVGRTNHSVIEWLQRQPQAFGFFQAIRVLLHHEFVRAQEGPARHPLGWDFPPGSEVARLKAYPSHAFPQSEIIALEFAKPAVDSDSPPPPPEITVGFMGLFGPSGVLPTHYTQTVIDETKERQGTPTLDFLNLFNHRMISLFYRAWEKYRLPVIFENARRVAPAARRRDDDISECIAALVGMAPLGTRRRQLIPHEIFLFYSGLFYSRPRNAVSLQRMLAEYFGLPIQVCQFVGEWLQLSDEQMTRLGSSAWPAADGNNRLGINSLAGSRVWNVESLLRVRIGPVRYNQFESLMPGQKKLQQISQFVRQYVGTTLETEYQIVLAKQDVPQMCMPGPDSSHPPPALGRNTWLLSAESPQDRDDAVIRYSGRIDCLDG